MAAVIIFCIIFIICFITMTNNMVDAAWSFWTSAGSTVIMLNFVRSYQELKFVPRPTDTFPNPMLTELPLGVEAIGRVSPKSEAR